MHSNLCKEIVVNTVYDLIIECCQCEPDKDKLVLLSSQINDWNGCLTSAYAHGVYPLVAKSLKSISTVPENIKHTLKFTNLDIARRNMMMTSELLRIMKLLEEQGINALAIKGPILSQIIHGDITTRQYSDIDILVSPEKIYDACKVLILENYHSDISLNVLKNTIYRKLEKDFYLQKISNNMQIEIHWELFDEKCFIAKSNDEILNDSDTIELNGLLAHTLNKDIALFHLLVHGSKHVWERVEWVVDIDRLLRLNHAYNWDYMLTVAKELDYENEFYLGLKVAQEIFNTPVPDAISQRYHTNLGVNSAFERVLIDWDQNRLLCLEEREIDRYTIYDVDLSFYDRTKRTLRFYMKKLTQVNSTDVRWITLPNSLNGLYYVIHPIRQLLEGFNKS